MNRQCLVHGECLRAVIFALIMLGCFVAPRSVDADEGAKPKAGSGELVWKSGDRLPGLPTGLDDGKLKFESSLFRKPLQIDLQWLKSIDYSKEKTPKKGGSKEAASAEEPFAIQCIDGQVFLGDIKSLDDKFLAVESARAGAYRIDRTKIASIVNRKVSQTLVSGSIDLDQWRSKRGDKRYWKPNADGEVVASRDDIHLYLESELPESCLIDLEVAWNSKLDFALALGVPNSARSLGDVPRIESWDGSIVFSHDEDFEIVMADLDESSKSLKLLIHWNQKTNILVVHDDTGAELATAKIESMGKKTKPGIFLLNKSGDFRVISLGVRSATPGFDPSETSIQLKSEDAVNATPASFDGQQWIANEGKDQIEIPADDFVAAFQLNPDAELKKSIGDTLRFDDGEKVIGKLVAVEDNRITIRTADTDEDLALKTDMLRQIQFHPDLESKPSESFNHVLHSDVGVLRGRLESGDPTDEDVLFWRVAGASEAVPFANSLGKVNKVNARVVLERKKDSKVVESKWPDTLFLNNRDWLAVHLKSANENEIVVESFFENTVIPGSQIRAVEFGERTQKYELDFADPEWEKSGKAKLSGKKFKLGSGACIGHKDLMGRGGFEFDLDWPVNSYGMLKVELGRALDEKGQITDKQSQTFSIMLYAQNFFIAAEGQGQNPGANMRQKVGSKAVRIKISVEKDKILVYGNGKKCFSDKISSGFGRCVSFKLNDMWNRKVTCELDDLELAEGFLSGEFIDRERKELVLTIPRLKARNPPGHILCARNFDLARGSIVSLDDEFIKFRTDNALNRYPRDLLGSIIWLDTDQLVKSLVDEKGEDDSSVEGAKDGKEPPEAKATNPEAGQVAQVLMHGGRRVTLNLKRWEEASLVGHSELLGDCVIPFDEIFEIRMGKFATQATDVPWSDWVAKLAPKPKLNDGSAAGTAEATIFGTESALIGKTPKLELEMLDDSKINLRSLKGQVVVLDFWATWCGPCVKSLPDVQQVIESYPESSVKLIAVNQNESKKKIDAFLKSRKLEKLKVALDDGDVSEEFKVEAIPQTVIIDQQGVIRFVKVGVSKDMEEKLKAAIDSLIDQEKDST